MTALGSLHWWGNPLWDWALALGGALLAYVLVHGLLHTLGQRLQRRATEQPDSGASVLASALRGTRGWLLLALALVAALRYLALPGRWPEALGQLVYLLAGLQLALWLSRLIVALLERLSQREGAPQNPVIFGILKWSAQLFVWVLLLLAVLGNVGVNVNAFIASLGVGGIAVALAAQSVLGDLLASISIGLDKPFTVGEYIGFGDQSGTVKRVGIKSTRIQALSGEEIAIANSELLKQRVHNYARMQERRIAFSLSVALGTPLAQVRRIVQEAPALIQSVAQTRFSRGHMTGIGESSIDFEFVYFVLSPDYAVYRDVQQQIYWKLLALLEQLQVPLAVPLRQYHQPEADGS